jgi:hypothetical protein
MRIAAALTIGWLPLWAAPYAGSSACAECHADIAQSQARSYHATSLRPVRAAPLFDLLVGATIRERGGFTLSYNPAPEGLSLTVSREAEREAALIEWAFGSGVQGYTPVGRRGAVYFEHRLSWYSQPQRLGITPGHAGGAATSASVAVGLDRTPEEAFRCFNCHSARVRRTGDGVDLTDMETGVRCERCHGPGAAHSLAAREKNDGAEVRRSIFNPGRFPARSLVEICGDCHRKPSPQQPSDTPEVDDPVSVRFQPVGLMASQCFRKSGKLSCLTCHNPHENAVRADGAFYSKKCAGCHNQPVAAGKHCRRASGQNCLPCHMRQAMPAPYLTFTDHRIRTYIE